MRILKLNNLAWYELKITNVAQDRMNMNCFHQSNKYRDDTRNNFAFDENVVNLG